MAIRLAGAKNDGAWFRTNQAIKRHRERGMDWQLRVQAVIENTDGFGPFKDAFVDTLTYYGAEPAVEITVHDLAVKWAASGIPREVWFGLPRQVKYEKVAIPGSDPVRYKWNDLTTAAWRTFAINLRYQLRNYFKADAFHLDVLNDVGADLGNPGGIADSDIET
jgi:hypothetical protein